MTGTRSRLTGVAAVTAAALALTACTGDDNADVTDSAEVTQTAPLVEADISFAYWGDFGVESLVEDYEEAHPGVTIELVPGDYNASHDNLQQALIAGSGAHTIAAIEESYIARFVAQSDSFVNLAELGAGEYEDAYLDWKWSEAASADGSTVIGVGAEINGLALCYRRDLFEAAGLPADRDEVAAAIGDTWEGFIEVGTEYQANAGNGQFFIDNAASLLDPLLAQSETSYYTTENVLEMAPVEAPYGTAVDVIAAGLAAGIEPWTAEWDAGFTSGAFAAVVCPSWMLGHIQGQAPDSAGEWDITELPGPGGNWGGSFYTIPLQGSAEEQQAAWDFIEWLIQPEQQLAIFQRTGKLPSQPALYEDPSIVEYTNDFFNDAPVGQIFTAAAADLPGPVYYAPNDANIARTVEDVLDEVQRGNVAIADAWATAVAAAEAADELAQPAS